jgi:hypothetical protein
MRGRESAKIICNLREVKKKEPAKEPAGSSFRESSVVKQRRQPDAEPRPIDRLVES